MSFLSISRISKKDDKGFELRHINFTQNKLQKIAIAGETGCGKTTLLKIIAGLVQPDFGNIYFEGKRIKGPLEELVPGHPKIAYLSQQFELPNFLSVHQVLIYANPLLDAEAENDEAAKALYKMCRIQHLLNRRTDELSGGEKQRVALARLLVSAPKLLLLDEPFSNLDMMHKNILKSVIEDVGEQLNITCLLVSHDPLDTLSWADEIIVMQQGQIVQQATPTHIYKQPISAYAAGLFGKYNSPSAALKKVLSLPENIFYRPEDFTISYNENEGIKAVVNNVFFYGSYWEIEVHILGEMLTIKTDKFGIKKEDLIYIISND